MSSPQIGSAITRPDLRGAIYREWDTNGIAATFIADRVLPELPVQQKSATVKVIDREQYAKIAAITRSERSGYNRIDFEVGETHYSIEEQGLECPVDTDKAAEMADYFSVETEAGDIALYRSRLAHEKRVADMMFNETTFAGHTTSAVTVWTTHASATPVNDILLASQAVYEACGVQPNTLILPREGWDNLKECDDVVDRLGSSSSKDPKIARLQSVAEIVDMQQILVAGALYDSADKGQDASLTDLWVNTHALVAYIRPRPAFDNLCLGGNLHWVNSKVGSEYKFRMEQYYEVANRQQIIRCRRHVEPKLISAECGYLISGIAA